MADHTKIEWTDATWNPVNGCGLASPGCTNCYAMKQAHRVPQRRGLTFKTKGGMVWTGEVRFDEQALLKPLRWKRPRRIFVCAHGDLFHESVPDEWIDRVFAIMALCPQHTFQVLTKRSARMRAYMDRACGRIGDAVMRLRKESLPLKLGLGPNGLGPVPHIEPGREWWPLPNVWLGVSVEDQARADERIPDLLATPAAVRWLSCEPLLGPVDLVKIELRPFGARPTDLSNRLGDYVQPLRGNFVGSPKINWVVVGGESGPHARPMHPGWARSLRDQCQAAGVRFFFKQWGEWFPYGHIDADGDINVRDCHERAGLWHVWPDRTADQEDHFSSRIGKKQAGRLLDGVEWSEYPT